MITAVCLLNSNHFNHFAARYVGTFGQTSLTNYVLSIQKLSRTQSSPILVVKTGAFSVGVWPGSLAKRAPTRENGRHVRFGFVSWEGKT